MTSSRTSPSSLDVSAARFVGDVKEEIAIAFLQELAERKLTKADIARALGVNRSVVSRILNGTAPLELRTIGQLAWALGRDPQFKLPKKKRRTRSSNYVASSNTINNQFGPSFSTVATP